MCSATTRKQVDEADRDAITIAPAFVAVIDNTAEVSRNHEHDAFPWASRGDAVEPAAFGGLRGVFFVGSKMRLSRQAQAGTC